MDKFPDDVVSLANELGVRLDDRIIAVAVRQHLTNLKRVRGYKKRMREDPETRDEWYAKRRECQRKRRRKSKAKQAGPKAVAKSKPARNKFEPRKKEEAPRPHPITDDESRDRRFAMIRERAEARG